MKVEYKTTNRMSKERIDEILRVHREKGLTAENLVEVARDEDSSLHELFDWNNDTAGEKFRLFQARQIINEVKVVIENKEVPAFEIITNVINEERESSTLLLQEKNKFYEPIVEILTDDFKKAQIISQALNHIDYWRKKYSNLKELKPIFDAVEKTKKKLQKPDKK